MFFSPIRKYCTLVCLWLCSAFAFGQTPQLDSLKNVYFHLPKTDRTARLEALSQIAMLTCKFVPDTALHYVGLGFELLGSQEVSEASLSLHESRANALYEQGNLEQAIPAAEQVADFTKDKNLRQQHIMAMLKLAVIHASLNQVDKSKQWFGQALDFVEEGEPAERALVYSYLHQYGESGSNLGYGEKALALFEAVGDRQQSMKMAFNLGSDFARKGDEVQAKLYYEKAMRFAEEANLLHLKAGAGIMLGQLMKKNKRFGEAEATLRQALADAETSGMRAMEGKAHAVMAGVYFDQEQYRQSIPHFEKAYQIALDVRDNEFQRQVLVDLKDAYEKTGNLQKAFDTYTLYEAAKDSVVSSETALLKAELEGKLKTKEQEAQLETQSFQIKRQRILNWAIGGIAALLLFLSFFIWKNLRQRQVLNQQLTEQTAALQALDSAKSRFFANISHELRTPLTLILAPLENAIEKVRSADAKNSLQTAQNNAKQLLTLVNEILDLSKLESGKMTLQESPVHLEKLLRRIFFGYHSLAQVRGFLLSFSYHLPEDLAVKLDVVKFEKVINNLLSNAFKYSRLGGTITMRAGQEDGQLKIEVQDTGKGIPPDQLEKIFERFYQAEGEDEPLQGGTGIGLAYANEIAQLFGGSLKVESEVGKGSTFIFRLPMNKTELKDLPVEEHLPATDFEKTAPVMLPLENGKPHLLIVEDNPEMSRFLVQSLSADFRCTTKSDGQEAIQYLLDCQQPTANYQLPDLITSDVMMPNIDGFTFLQKVHELEAYCHTPVILLTARAMEEDKLKGFALGVDDYLTKPFSTKELIARIHNLLKNKRVREEVVKDPDFRNLEDFGNLSHEEQLVKQAEALVIEHLSDGSYKVSNLASDLAYSPRQLERILKKMTGLSPVEFMREIRLQKAYRMLEERRFATVAEVRYEVGMENASHFTKKFRERFGKNPGEVNESYTQQQ